MTQYARDVVAGKIVAGRPVRLACERHLRDLKRKDLDWRPDAAQLALDFPPEMLRLEDGKPFVLLPYQQFIVGSLFGWYGIDGFRRYHDAYVETGKGSGKTPMAAGAIGLYGLIADNEPAAEVYSAATMKDQAKIAWTDADRMIEQSPELSAVVKREAACLSYGTPERVFRPVSSEHKGLDGKRPHIAIIDELHEHPTDIVVNKMRAGTKRRRNAIIFRITNSGFDRTSVCWKEHDYSIKVLEGTVTNDAWFAYLCALDPGDSWLNEAVWPKANPGMHADLPPISYLRDQVTNAVGMPSKENITKRLNFCVWTEADERWLDMQAWDQGSIPVTADLRGMSCFAGLDGASTNDIFSFVMLFGPDADGVYDVVPRFWIPEDTLNAKNSGRDERTRLQLKEWVGQGFMRTTSGAVIDDDIIEEQILADLALYDLKELAFDRWGVRLLITHLKDKLGTRRNPVTGKEESRVIDFPQNMGGMSAASKRVEELVVAGKLRHGGHPVLRWMASNAAIKHGPNEQIKVDREASSDKIDGVIAMVMAVAREMVEAAEGESVLERRPMRVLGEASP